MNSNKQRECYEDFLGGRHYITVDDIDAIAIKANELPQAYIISDGTTPERILDLLRFLISKDQAAELCDDLAESDDNGTLQIHGDYAEQLDEFQELVEDLIRRQRMPFQTRRQLLAFCFREIETDPFLLLSILRHISGRSADNYIPKRVNVDLFESESKENNVEPKK